MNHNDIPSANNWQPEVARLLPTIGKDLALFLEDRLSAISSIWWKTTVEEAFSIHQVRHLKEEKIHILQRAQIVTPQSKLIAIF